MKRPNNNRTTRLAIGFLLGLGMIQIPQSINFATNTVYAQARNNVSFSQDELKAFFAASGTETDADSLGNRYQNHIEIRFTANNEPVELSTKGLIASGYYLASDGSVKRRMGSQASSNDPVENYISFAVSRGSSSEFTTGSGNNIRVRIEQNGNAGPSVRSDSGNYDNNNGATAGADLYASLRGLMNQRGVGEIVIDGKRYVLNPDGSISVYGVNGQLEGTIANPNANANAGGGSTTQVTYQQQGSFPAGSADEARARLMQILYGNGGNGSQNSNAGPGGNTQVTWGNQGYGAGNGNGNGNSQNPGGQEFRIRVEQAGSPGTGGGSQASGSQTTINNGQGNGQSNFPSNGNQNPQGGFDSRVSWTQAGAPGAGSGSQADYWMRVQQGILDGSLKVTYDDQGVMHIVQADQAGNPGNGSAGSQSSSTQYSVSSSGVGAPSATVNSVWNDFLSKVRFAQGTTPADNAFDSASKFLFLDSVVRNTGYDVVNKNTGTYNIYAANLSKLESNDSKYSMTIGSGAGARSVYITNVDTKGWSGDWVLTSKIGEEYRLLTRQEAELSILYAQAQLDLAKANNNQAEITRWKSFLDNAVSHDIAKRKGDRYKPNYNQAAYERVLRDARNAELSRSVQAGGNFSVDMSNQVAYGPDGQAFNGYRYSVVVDGNGVGAGSQGSTSQGGIQTTYQTPNLNSPVQPNGASNSTVRIVLDSNGPNGQPQSQSFDIVVDGAGNLSDAQKNALGELVKLYIQQNGSSNMNGFQAWLNQQAQNPSSAAYNLIVSFTGGQAPAGPTGPLASDASSTGTVTTAVKPPSMKHMEVYVKRGSIYLHKTFDIIDGYKQNFHSEVVDESAVPRDADGNLILNLEREVGSTTSSGSTSSSSSSAGQTPATTPSTPSTTAPETTPAQEAREALQNYLDSQKSVTGFEMLYRFSDGTQSKGMAQFSKDGVQAEISYDLLQNFMKEHGYDVHLTETVDTREPIPVR